VRSEASSSAYPSHARGGRAPERFQQAIEFGHEQRRAGTRLYASLADLAKAPKEGDKAAQRALIVFSDGLDNKDGKDGQGPRRASWPPTWPSTRSR
jgi:hypothetical protein